MLSNGTGATATAATAAEVPEERVSEAAMKLDKLEIENTNFAMSFVGLELESATEQRVLEVTPASVKMQKLNLIVSR